MSRFIDPSTHDQKVNKIQKNPLGPGPSDMNAWSRTKKIPESNQSFHFLKNTKNQNPIQCQGEDLSISLIKTNEMEIPVIKNSKVETNQNRARPDWSERNGYPVKLNVKKMR